MTNTPEPRDKGSTHKVFIFYLSGERDEVEVSEQDFSDLMAAARNTDLLKGTGGIVSADKRRAVIVRLENVSRLVLTKSS
jgi:hypothetical protein